MRTAEELKTEPLQRHPTLNPLAKARYRDGQRILTRIDKLPGLARRRKISEYRAGNVRSDGDGEKAAATSFEMIPMRRTGRVIDEAETRRRGGSRRRSHIVASRHQNEVCILMRVSEHALRSALGDAMGNLDSGSRAREPCSAEKMAGRKPQNHAHRSAPRLARAAFGSARALRGAKIPKLNFAIDERKRGGPRSALPSALARLLASR